MKYYVIKHQRYKKKFTNRTLHFTIQIGYIMIPKVSKMEGHLKIHEAICKDVRNNASLSYQFLLRPDFEKKNVL